MKLKRLLIPILTLGLFGNVLANTNNTVELPNGYRASPDVKRRIYAMAIERAESTLRFTEDPKWDWLLPYPRKTLQQQQEDSIFYNVDETSKCCDFDRDKFISEEELKWAERGFMAFGFPYMTLSESEFARVDKKREYEEIRDRKEERYRLFLLDKEIEKDEQ